MTRVSWDTSREYETGLDRGVYYPRIGPGEVWNGLVSVNESSSDSDEHTRYLDGVKTHLRRREGYFEGTLETLQYPSSFYTGVIFARRNPERFGFSYRTMTSTHYRLHLVYNASLKSSEYTYQNNDVTGFKWDFGCVPIPVPGMKRTAHLVIETAIAYSWVVEAVEDILYGTDEEEPRLPLPQEIVDLFESLAILRIIDNGDGTWTAIGPDSAIEMLDIETFQITWPSAVYLTADTYTISSL